MTAEITDDGDPKRAIGAMAEVPADFEAVLDKRILTVEEILTLQAGCVIPLTRSAGENIDIYINDVLIGFGEIVIIENTMAVRITDLCGQE